MTLQRVGRAMTFLAGCLIGGLALAFILVYINPGLLRRSADTASERAAGHYSAGVPATGAAERTARTAAAPAAVPAEVPAAASAAPRSASAGDAPGALVAESFAAAVKRAAPAVVNISTARLVTEQIEPSVFDQLFGDLRPMYRRRVERALGSGVIVDSAGHIITNNHVIANADTIMVQLADGRVTRASVVGRDPDTDLAVLSIRLPHLPVMPLGRSDALQVGDGVLAIGNPLGLSQTVTHGIVSATGRSQLGVATFENFIQTDAAINAGNSGGALINTLGDLIGINTAVLGKNSGGDISVEGIGFAIPVNLARGVMQEILDHGRVIRGWSGILPEDVDDQQAAQLGLPRGGVVVTNLYRNSPAVQAGLRLGDIDTLVQIAGKKPGSSTHLHVLRGHSELDLTLAVTERPSST
jgi:S1-C subfamily serine protease